MDQEIEKKVTGVFAAQAEMAEDEISCDSGLMDDIGLNSMEVLSSVSILENEFSIRIPERDLRFFVTVGDVVEYISGKI